MTEQYETGKFEKKHDKRMAHALFISIGAMMVVAIIIVFTLWGHLRPF